MTPATAPPPRLLTAEEYARLPDTGTPTELVRGRVSEMTPPYPFHGLVCGNIRELVGAFVRQAKLGRMMSNDSGVITERDPDTVRGADVCFYSYKRLPHGPIPEDGYFTVVPDLVFEVMSPSDRWPKVMKKVTEYLDVGVSVVCVVIPWDRTAVVYRDNPKPETFAADAELVFPDVLPGFRVPLRQFFE